MSNHPKRYHRLLERQLRKAFGRGVEIPPEWQAFLDMVNESYIHGDQDRKMLERSMDLSSQELMESNRGLRQRQQELEEALEELRSTQQELQESQELLALSNKLEEANHQLIAQKRELERAYDELQQTQSQLVHAEKMSSLGQLTAGVAHEINNPVNFIYAGIQALREVAQDIFMYLNYYEDLRSTKGEKEMNELLDEMQDLHLEVPLNVLKDDLLEMINSIESGAERTAEIVKGLRSFSRVDRKHSEFAYLSDLIDSTLVILRSQLKDGVSVHKRYDSTSQVPCFPSQLNQVFMNILSNANQAIQENGNIYIELFDSEDLVEMHIFDDGPGVPEEAIDKIFDPFFTTKAIGEGTGLGLSISYGIIQEHKGQLKVENKEGKGANFIITLPKYL